MVPGESMKGKPQASASHVPPSMPSERVVTGNANPQPVPPPRSRSPPDGPGVVQRHMSSGPNSDVPAVRSEAVGSEDLLVTRPQPDRRYERDDSPKSSRRYEDYEGRYPRGRRHESDDEEESEDYHRRDRRRGGRRKNYHEEEDLYFESRSDR